MEDRSKSDITTLDLGLWFTNSCNLNCTYCYIRRKTDESMSVELAQELIARYLSEPGVHLDILFMGAEPLTRFGELRQIVEWTSSRTWARAYHFTAATNGTLLTDEMKEWFTAHRDVVCLGLSYDGSDGDQDENRCASSGRIDREFFLKNWPKQPWKVTISRKTASNIDRGLIELHEMGALFTANAAYEEEPWNEGEIAAYELALYRLADYYAAHPEIKVCNLLDSLPEPLPEPGKVRQDKACGAGDSLCFYDMEGNAYPCHMLSPLVLPRERTVRGERFSEDEDFEDPRCRLCPLKTDCYTCLGTNHIYRGSVRLRDPLHCRLYQAEIRATMHMWIEVLRDREAYTAREREMLRRLRALYAAFESGSVGMRQPS